MFYQDQYQGSSQAGAETVDQTEGQQQPVRQVAQAAEEGQQSHQRWRDQLHLL